MMIRAFVFVLAIPCAMIVSWFKFSLRDLKTAKYRDFHHVEGQAEHNRGKKRSGHEAERQRVHEDSAQRQRRDDQDISDGRQGKQETWTRAPYALPSADTVGSRLRAEDERDDTKGSQCLNTQL